MGITQAEVDRLKQIELFVEAFLQAADKDILKPQAEKQNQIQSFFRISIEDLLSRKQ